MIAAAFLFPVQATAQTNTLMVDAEIQAIPVDVEVTPNGLVAAVRANIPGNDLESDWKVSFWDTTTGARIYPSVPNMVGRGNLPVVATTDKPMFCNALAVTNSGILAIGSADTQGQIGGEISTEDTTYVDFLAIRYNAITGKPEVQFILRHELKSPNPTPSNQMGGAHDVEVTPDGSFAVVSHNNWVHIFSMFTGAQLYGYNTGASGACTSIHSRNSVEVTNTQAVVTTGRWIHPLGYETDFYVFNLLGTPSLLSSGTVPHLSAPPGQGYDFGPHDLAITPDKGRVLIAANRAVYLYDISSLAAKGSYQDNEDTRRWQASAVMPSSPVDLWDAIEVSDSRAVVLSNRVGDSSGTYDSKGWRIQVFDIGPGADISYPQYRLWSLDADDPAVNYAGEPAWDLAMSSDGLQATVKGQVHDMALLDLVQPLPGTDSFISLGTNPIHTSLPSSGLPAYNDSTVLLVPDLAQDPPQRWAAFLGSDGGIGQVRTILVDLANGPWQGGYSTWNLDFVTEPNGIGNLRAADLALTARGNGFVTRQSAPVDDHGIAGGVDWIRYSGIGGPTPPRAGASWGGRGVCTGADNLRISRNKSVSISRSDEFGAIRGWIHIVTL